MDRDDYQMKGVLEKIKITDNSEVEKEKLKKIINLGKIRNKGKILSRAKYDVSKWLKVWKTKMWNSVTLNGFFFEQIIWEMK